MSSTFSTEYLDQDGYPAWVMELAEEEPTVALSVVRGIGPAEALERMGCRAGEIRPIQLPIERPADRWSSRTLEALGVEPGDDVAMLATQVGDWTLVFCNGYAMTEDLVELSAGGLEAAACTVNIELDTHLEYAVDGEQLFWVGEPVTIYDVEELPEGLQDAARATGIYDRDEADAEKGDGYWDVAENFLLVCALAGLEQLTLDDLRRLPLLGWSPAPIRR